MTDEVREAAERIVASLIRGVNYAYDEPTIDEFLASEDTESYICDSVDADDIRILMVAAMKA